MSDMVRVVCVDDSSIIRDTLSSQLGTVFDLCMCESAEDALKEIGSRVPDVVVTDVEMPAQNGYELCDVIKNNPATAHIPVIFLSSTENVRERMLGYEVGGEDFVIKGSSSQELIAKIKVVAKRVQYVRSLDESAQSAQKTAVEAMTTSAELGKAVRFIEQSYVAKDFSDLGTCLMDWARSLELSASCMFIGRQETFFLSSSGEISPLEQNLMLSLHQGDRFIDFGCRTLVNYPNVTILIKNMPLDERESYGRIKDVLPFVLGATDAKVRVLDTEKALTEQCAQLTDSTDSLKSVLDEVQSRFNNTMTSVGGIMAELRATMAMDIQRMDCTEEDEIHIIEMVESAGRKLEMNLQENTSSEAVLKEIIDLLQRLSSEQNTIVESMLTAQSQPEGEITGDVELF